MKITFQNAENNRYQDLMNTGMVDKKQKTGSQTNCTNASDFNSSFGVQVNLGSNHSPLSGEKSKTSMSELQEEFQSIDVGISQDYNTVLAHTLSGEDYEKAKEEGFQIGALSQEDTVTIQDRVKAEVAMSGKVVEGYTDTVDQKVLAEALGNEMLAAEISKSFTMVDLPMTEENIQEIAKAYDLEKNLTTVTEAASVFLLENELKPTIWNLYLANNSKGQDSRPLTEVLDQQAQIPEEIQKLLSNPGFASQVDAIVQKAGMDGERSSEGTKLASFLLEHNLPLTEDSLQSVSELKNISLPLTQEQFAGAVTKAVLDNLSPMEASVINLNYPVETIYQQAAALLEDFSVGDDIILERYGKELSSRRMLEEVRLSMTAEVNVKLLESGFSLDTAPMEELIDALKKAEEEVAKRYFPKEEAPVDRYRLMNHTNDLIAQIQSQPVSSVGMFLERAAKDVSLEAFGEEGTLRKDIYEKAGESYEALMTSPRADLGDSIRKAFSNIDDILEGLHIEKNNENRRAVRILGYNSMPINEQNIDVIREADHMVGQVIEKMKPAMVLQMIRAGVNPLESTFQELADYISLEEERVGKDDTGNYAEYLLALEQHNQITEEERASYIGIYRMLHQIEKTDGAAIGMVMHEQVVLNFSNLLSAVRSSRHGSIDAKISDNFGGLTELVKQGNSITDQIRSAFSSENYQQEQQQLRDDLEYYKQKAHELISEDRHMQALLSSVVDSNNSIENMTATTLLLSSDQNLYSDIQKLFQKGEAKKRPENEGNNRKETFENLVRDFRSILDHDDSFEEEYLEASERLQAFVEELAIEEADTYVDVRAMQLVSRQLSISRTTSWRNDETEDYIIPMQVGDQMGKVHLAMQKGDMPEVDIRVILENDSSMEGHFSIREDMLTGYITGSEQFGLQNMEDVADRFYEAIQSDSMFSDIKIGDIPVVKKGEWAQSERLARGISSSKQLREQEIGKDAVNKKTDGAEREMLLRITKEFLGCV